MSQFNAKNGGAATTILRDPMPDKCSINTTSSRMCERGTVSCTTVHDPPQPPPDKAADLLDEAKRIVTGARQQTYGHPEDNFQCIAELWSSYLGRRRTLGGLARGEHGSLNLNDKLSSGDVAVMMILIKAARLAESPDHHDSAVDIAGYAACLAMVQK